MPDAAPQSEITASGFRPLPSTPGRAGPESQHTGVSASGFRPIETPQQGVGESLWEGLKNFGKGVAGGLAGEGVPAGRASEFRGGQSGFGGRMLGAGARSVWEGLQDAVMKTGKISMGDESINPADRLGMVKQAIPTAMMMAGQGGRRPLVTEEATAVAPGAVAPATTAPLRAATAPPPAAAGEQLPLPGISPTPTPTPAATAPAAPIISDATTSPLARAIAGNDGTAVDRELSRTYRRAVKPGQIGQPSMAGLKAQDYRILTAVDQIIANRPNLKLTDASGVETSQQLPRSLSQFAEAIDQTKRSVFEQYDQRARAAGASGVQVDLAPVVQKLREIGQTPEVMDLHPAVAADAERLAATMEARRSYTPSEAQDVVQNLNKTLAGFWRNPTNETVSRSTLLAPVASTLRAQLDAAIEGAGAPGYQALRQQYGALRSVEKDVAAAVQRNANKIPGGMPGMFGDLAATEEFLRGVVTMNPAAVGRAAGIKLAQKGLKYLREPNRAVSRMFDRRVDRPLRQPYGRGVGALGGYGAGVTDDPRTGRGPMGGPIIQQRSIQRPASGYPSS